MNYKLLPHTSTSHRHLNPSMSLKCFLISIFKVKKKISRLFILSHAQLHRHKVGWFSSQKRISNVLFYFSKLFDLTILKVVEHLFRLRVVKRLLKKVFCLFLRGGGEGVSFKIEQALPSFLPFKKISIRMLTTSSTNWKGKLLSSVLLFTQDGRYVDCVATIFQARKFCKSIFKQTKPFSLKLKKCKQ